MSFLHPALRTKTLACLAANAAIAASALLLVPRAKAEISGIAPAGTVDFFPGTDFYPRHLAVDRAEHKLYAVEGVDVLTNLTQQDQVKVFDTVTDELLGEVDLGRYAGDAVPFRVIGMALDPTAAPEGKKLYIVGRAANRANPRLRVIDTQTQANETGEGTDVFLPISATADASKPGELRPVVNTTNHKIYIAQDSKIVVVDGPERKVLATLANDYGTMLVASPAANKVFVLGRNGGASIDSSTDTITPLPVPLDFQAQGAVLDEARSRIYAAGLSGDNLKATIYVIDAHTGALLMSKVVGPYSFWFGESLAIDPVDGDTLYVGMPNTFSAAANVFAYDADDLSPTGAFPGAASQLEIASGTLFVAGERDYAITKLDLALTQRELILTAYTPERIAINRHTNRIYITDAVAPHLMVLDGSSHELIALVELPPNNDPSSATSVRVPREICISEDLNRVYVARYYSDGSGPSQDGYFVDVIDGVTHEVRSTLPVSNTSMAVDDVRDRLYFGGTRHVIGGNVAVYLDVFDSSTETRLTSVDVFADFRGYPMRIAVNPLTGRTYVSYSERIRIIDGNTLVPVATVASAFSPYINQRTNKIYFFTSAGEIGVIDGATDSVERTFQTPAASSVSGRNAIAIDEETNRLYLSEDLKPDEEDVRIAGVDAANNYAYLGDLLIPGGKDADLAFNPVTRQLVTAASGTVIFLQAEGTAPSPPSVTSASTAGGVQQQPFSYQITGSNGPTSYGAFGLPAGLTLDRVTGLISGTPTESGSFIVTISVSNSTGLATAQLALTFAAAPPPAPRQMLNISTRLRVQTGENVLIAGLIVSGSEPKKVIIRAVGPSLSDTFGSALQDPELELYQGDTLLAANDDWQTSQRAEIEATSVAPGSVLESAIVRTLQPGVYTAVMRGKEEATGIGLIEVYDLDAGASSKLANIASRGFVEAGENVMIGGLIVGGSGTENTRVLLRALGPSLASSGVANALQDPVLELRNNSGELVRANDNWQESQQAEIEATTIAPANTAESAIIATLPAGDYTAILYGRAETSGVAVVEAYQLP